MLLPYIEFNNYSKEKSRDPDRRCDVEEVALAYLDQFDMWKKI